MIPLMRPDVDERDFAAVRDALASGMFVQGPRVAAFEARIARETGRRHAVAMSSGTTALVAALEALGIGPGDEVLCPNLTWPSPGHAVQLVGATCVLVDVDARTWNAAAADFARARTERTRAAIAIDQFGAPADVPAIEAALPGVTIVEDAACAIGSALRGQACGSFGVVSCLSFHPRKVLTTGEGGMCLTDDDAICEALRELRNHGQRSPGDFRRAASNYRLGELAAALGLSQAEKLTVALPRRRALATRYRDALPELTWQELLPGSTWNAQTCGALLPAPTTASARDAFIAAVRAAGVEVGRLSYALSREPPFAPSSTVSHRAGPFPASEGLMDRGIALPLYATMTDAEHDTVLATVRQVGVPHVA